MFNIVLEEMIPEREASFMGTALVGVALSETTAADTSMDMKNEISGESILMVTGNESSLDSSLIAPGNESSVESSSIATGNESSVESSLVATGNESSGEHEVAQGECSESSTVKTTPRFSELLKEFERKMDMLDTYYVVQAEYLTNTKDIDAEIEECLAKLSKVNLSIKATKQTKEMLVKQLLIVESHIARSKKYRARESDNYERLLKKSLYMKKLSEEKNARIERAVEEAKKLGEVQRQQKLLEIEWMRQELAEVSRRCDVAYERLSKTPTCVGCVDIHTHVLPVSEDTNKEVDIYSAKIDLKDVNRECDISPNHIYVKLLAKCEEPFKLSCDKQQKNDTCDFTYEALYV